MKVYNCERLVRQVWKCVTLRTVYRLDQSVAGLKSKQKVWKCITLKSCVQQGRREWSPQRTAAWPEWRWVTSSSPTSPAPSSVLCLPSSLRQVWISSHRKLGALRPQKPLRRIRDGEVGGSGIFISNTYSPHCHHQNDSALKWAAVWAILMFH